MNVEVITYHTIHSCRSYAEMLSGFVKQMQLGGVSKVFLSRGNDVQLVMCGYILPDMSAVNCTRN